MTDTTLLDTPALEEPSETNEAEEIEDDPEVRIARLILEDFLVTQLLSRGRTIKSSEITALSEGFSPTRNALKIALDGSQLVELNEREWELSLRSRIKSTPRDQRGRLPLETTLKSFLLEIGKPLPLPVVVREVSVLRGSYPEYVGDTIAQALKNARWAIEVRDKTYLPDSLTFDATAPKPEVVLRENNVQRDPDFDYIESLELELTGDIGHRALQVLEAATQPISQKLLGYVLWKHDAAGFDGRALARALGDRTKFYTFIGSYIAPQSQMAMLKNLADAWAEENGGTVAQVDTAAMLRHRVPPNKVLSPSAEQLAEIEKFAAGNGGNPFSIGTLLTDVLEMEADDARFVPLLQGINDALRRDRAFLAAGIGAFLLRSSVPEHIGSVPDVLRPVSLSVTDPDTNEPLDIEMSDDGLEGDAVDFVHAPQWEDISEEVEVRLPRRGDEVDAQIEYVLLNHHFRGGTLKLRRMDEEFFAIQGALSRLNLRVYHDDKIQNLAAWTSRDSGLIYGLGEWLNEKVPASGATLIFARDPQAALNTPIDLRIGETNAQTFIDENRLAELQALRETAKYLSLFELLQRILADGAMELPQLWAQVNVVRRTTKRLMCSVLCAYSCFSFKQRGQKEFQWRFEAGKIDAGFKKNKRKFVRR